LLEHWQHIEDAASIFQVRFSAKPSPFDGWLTSSAGLLRHRFGPDYGWSTSRLESYRACPFQFFLTRVLELEQRPEPQEGFDARQLGNIYHRIFEETYERLPLGQRMDPEKLQISLEAALERVLLEAPKREGFRETSWWSVTQDEIRRNARRSLAALLDQSDSFIPAYFELYFGRSRRFTVERQDDRFLLRGIIDRVDIDGEGNVRLIDYKTAGPYAYDRVAHRDGKRLQLPLYALAVEQALDLGEVVDGFYWHVQHAERSRFTLKEAGIQEAMDNAVGHAWETIEAVREGDFAPEPPDGGCPDYCPGAAFCWRYSPRQSY
jgi:ATP-dependent helicase/DNAse subunit B